MNPHRYPTLFLTIMPKTYDRKETASSTTGKVVICWQKTKTRPMPVTLNYYQLTWIKDLNITPKTWQLVHERAGILWKQQV
jgi:hypothetical protein